MNKIITINRQFSSGGREIGKRLADLLKVAYYDRELIQKISEETKMDSNYIAQYSESAVSRNYPFTFNRSFIMPAVYLSDQVQMAQEKVIKELAKHGNCIIVGRCANYILEDSFKVFIYSSDMGARIKRCKERDPSLKDKSEKELIKQINNIDKNRSRYYNYYTGLRWTDMNCYNLCIDTSATDIKKAVSIIAIAVR